MPEGIPIVTAPAVKDSPWPDPALQIDRALVEALRPDVVLRVETRHEQPPDFVPGAWREIVLRETTLEGVLDGLLRVGEGVGRGTEAAAALVRLRERMYLAADYTNPYDDGPSVAVVVPRQTPWCPGDWVAQIVERAGGMYPLCPTQLADLSGAAVGPQQAQRVPRPGRTVGQDEIEASDPDHVIIVADPSEPAIALKSSWYRELRATAMGRAAVVSPRVIARPGPELIDTLEWLTGWLNGRPEIMPPRFPWRLLGAG